LKDRIVQYPNRFKLTQVSGDIYDITPEPGIVTEAGDALNKANLLPDSLAAALGLSGNPQPKDALSKLNDNINGLNFLYEKIRDIADVSATTSLSIDVSDINWTVWREIRLFGSIKNNSGTGTTKDFGFRLDNLSTLYRFARVAAGAAYVQSTTGTEMASVRASGNTPNAPFDVVLQVQRTDSTNYQWYWQARFMTAGNKDHAMTIGNLTDKSSAFSTINIIAESGLPFTLQKASLWGIKQ
jgi:hypothetical protein